jgi:hypothetical protein
MLIPTFTTISFLFKGSKKRTYREHDDLKNPYIFFLFVERTLAKTGREAKNT